MTSFVFRLPDGCYGWTPGDAEIVNAIVDITQECNERGATDEEIAAAINAYLKAMDENRRPN